MPLGKLSFSNEMDDENEGIKNKMIVQFDRDSLLSNFDKWGSQVKNEIIHLPPYFEINKYLDELKESITNIHLVLIEIRLPELIDGVKNIEYILAPLKKHKGTPCIIDFSQMKNEGRNLQIEFLPLDLIEKVNNITN